MRRSVLSGSLEDGRRELLRRDDHYLYRGGRFTKSRTTGTVEQMVDRVSVHQRGSSPSHVDMAGRTNGRLELAKCSFDFVHHAWSRRLLLRSTYRTVWTFATVQMWTPKGQPRIFPSGCWLVLPEIADNRRTGIVLKIEKPRNYGAFYGGRTRDRTLDLSRVKGTLSR